jgi:hypothetical protein
MQRKPDDRRAVPLNHGCHMRQHQCGESAWWEAVSLQAGRRINPLLLACRYYEQYHRENPNANPPYVRKLRSIKPRKPRDQRAKIRSRNDLRKSR